MTSPSRGCERWISSTGELSRARGRLVTQQDRKQRKLENGWNNTVLAPDVRNETASRSATTPSTGASSHYYAKKTLEETRRDLRISQDFQHISSQREVSSTQSKRLKLLALKHIMIREDFLKRLHTATSAFHLRDCFQPDKSKAQDFLGSFLCRVSMLYIVFVQDPVIVSLCFSFASIVGVNQ